MTDNTTAPPEQDGATQESAFGRSYWMLNTIEMFERLAYFGLRSVVPIYIMQATEPGGLHLTALHKGWIYMWWALLQSWLPMFTGGIADRYGYKKVLGCAIVINVIGYLIMAGFPSYYGFFTGILVLATGTAFFKPALQGSIAQNLTKENSSMGWGLFYWVVNVGAVMAPVLATIILGIPHSAEGWRKLFLASAAYTCVNLLVLLTFKDVPSGADKTLSLGAVFVRTIENIWPFWLKGGRFHSLRGPMGVLLIVVGLALVILVDGYWVLGLGLFGAGMLLATWLEGGQFVWQLRLPAFLLIMSCFWMMMYQLWDLHPNFITDWVDSSDAARRLRGSVDIWWEYGDRGLLQVPQQILLNLNAALIVALVIPISWLVRKMRTLSAMLIGMSVATVGILVAGLTGNVWVLLLGIVFFSLGEMLTGPKKNEYLGLIAPPGKKALYLGYVNIPIGIGVGFGSMIAGVVYDNYGEKATLSLKYLATHPQIVARAAQSIDWSDSLEKLPPLMKIDRSDAFKLAQADMGVDAQTAAQTLRDTFRYDRGQIDNLALQYIALHAEYRAKTAKGFTELAEDLSETLDERAKALTNQVDQLVESAQKAGEGDGQADGEIPGANDVAADLDRLILLETIVRAFTDDRADIQHIGIARFVHHLPDVVGKKRVVAFEIVREELVNKDAPPEQTLDDVGVVAMLWETFGNDPEVLNNMALEYLAQATPRISDAIGQETLADAPVKLKERIKDIKERIGIGRTKSFVALSAATGADDAAVGEALRAMNVTTVDMQDRAYTYLINKPHHRFQAVARKDWSEDKKLLQKIIGVDEDARKVVLAEIDVETWSQSTWKSVKGIFVDTKDRGELAEDGINYTKLARKQSLIQKALDAKDWSNSHTQAAQLLGLNPFEARALVAAEVNQSPLAVTQLLWEEYGPQYKVWIPFAVIGVIAAIALAIFGHKAKGWADMNA